VHRLYQCYNSLDAGKPDPNGDAVRRFAAKFRREHRGPDWIEFKDLRQLDPVEVTVTATESPVAGGGTRVTPESAIKFTVRPWTWTDVVWHYEDGSSAVYPDFSKIDWSKE
jgi:hypothetical protein